MSMLIQAPGPQPTLQDGGRTGLMASGFSPAGVLDTHSMTIANLLVGNREDEAVLEMPYIGITALFEAPAVIALAGGDCGATRNGASIPPYTAVSMKAGDVLAMGAVRTGCLAYLAVSGGFAVDPVLGSCSTVLKCRLGGFQGRRLEAGDRLPFRESRESLPDMEDRVYKPRVIAGSPLVIRAVPGPQAHLFSARGRKAFFGPTFKTSVSSDRMGVRLEGEPVPFEGTTDIISDGIPPGAVQIPSSGLPIVLLADRQTTGGYAKIATVIGPDLPLLVQARPGTPIRFRAVSVGAGRRAWKACRREYDKLTHRWAPQFAGYQG